MQRKAGTSADAVKDADVYKGVSVASVLTGEMIKVMNKDSIVFALANPIPEIISDEARDADSLFFYYIM